jgi:hypothetical protein
MTTAASTHPSSTLGTASSAGNGSGAAPEAARWSERFVDLVSRYPKLSLAGAFAIGYLVARGVRGLGED